MNNPNLACCAYHAQFCEQETTDVAMSEAEIEAAEELIEHAKREEAEALRQGWRLQGYGDLY